jgi:hypothetical protein
MGTAPPVDVGAISPEHTTPERICCCVVRLVRTTVAQPLPRSLPVLLNVHWDPMPVTLHIAWMFTSAAAVAPASSRAPKSADLHGLIGAS